MATSALPSAPSTGGSSSSTLSSWAGPYVTDMLGQAQAIAATPYQTYQGPMTAGESGLQSKVFQGLGNLTMPQNMGGTFAQQGGPFFPQYGGGPAGGPPPMSPMGTPMQPGLAGENLGPQDMGGASGPMRMPGPPSEMGGSTGQPSSVAQSYMNPYLQSVMQPQLEELRRQSQITQMGNAAKMTGAGAFGGARQGIMDAETQRNLMQEMNRTVGQGYATAFDKGTNQFNIEQGQGMGLANLLAQQGAAQRGIEQEGITADYNEFLAQRDYPMKQTQYLQSMLQGLPISTVTSAATPQSGLGQITSAVGGVGSLLESLKKLGIGK